ncbi:MAG TPA: hypothetical protein VHJ20_22950 [Polyangia bacterium]|nr:hypothetical protein [Polyangia bacterium]
MKVASRQDRRFGAAFVAAFVLLCQAAAWVHAAATPHVTCVEHGESVHLVGAATDASAQPAADDALSAAPVATASHAHEHCGVVGHRTTVAPAPTPAAPLATIDAPAIHVGTHAVLPTTVLSFAPKTSPPRASSV